MGFFKEMKHRVQFNNIERKKNRIITRQNITMKMHSLPGETKAAFNRWWYNLVNDIREIKTLKGSLRLGIWLSAIGIIAVWAVFRGWIYPVLQSIIQYSAVGGDVWLSLTKEIAGKIPFIPNIDEFLLSLDSPFLGNTVIGWLTALTIFVVQFVIWVVPALFLVKHYSKTKGIRSYSKMLKRPFSLRGCWISAVVIVAWVLISTIPAYIQGDYNEYYIRNGFAFIQILSNTLPNTICEEFLLRGWFLNALNTKGGPVYSSVWVTIIYLLLLLPKWILMNAFSNISNILILIPVTFITTFMLCLAYNRSRSLWTSLGLRFFWALTAILFPTI